MRNGFVRSCSSCARGTKRADDRIACGAPVEEDGKKPTWARRQESFGVFFALAPSVGFDRRQHSIHADDMAPHDGTRCELWIHDPERTK